MEKRGQRRRWDDWWMALHFSLLLCFRDRVSAQIKYSIQEEAKAGSVVGNVASDLGLDVSSLMNRRFRIVSGSKEALFQVNQNTGVLYVDNTVDREELCDDSGACSINLKIVVENPLEIHYVTVEITDVNDNFPSFHEKEQFLELAENTITGRRFELQTARDLDVGINSVRYYKLNPNDNFDLELSDSGYGDKSPHLVLKKTLDREKSDKHILLLTALDGGNPPKSGTLNITVTVLDINDNRPVCSQETYSVTLEENATNGTIVTTVNATDLDDGVNGQVEYSFGRVVKHKIQDMFQLDKVTGEIRVKGKVDFEKMQCTDLV
ncbi:protocadherin gamma-A11-like [Alosa alosa]|uniref:protocadherin gamma-A11-like n=1 Tax=Alosa alosa TaxID=278164 RepID=UPI00201503E2|nr:protocadherin gamma-A11-like [Alosa alosa]